MEKQRAAAELRVNVTEVRTISWRHMLDRMRAAPRHRRCEMAAILGLVGVLGGVVLLGELSLPLAFTLHLPLLWAALRCNPWGVAATTLLIWALAAIGTAFDRGPFSNTAPHTSLLLLAVFLACTGAVSLWAYTAVRVQRRMRTGLVGPDRATTQPARASVVTPVAAHRVDLDSILTSAERLWSHLPPEHPARPLVDDIVVAVHRVATDGGPSARPRD